MIIKLFGTACCNRPCRNHLLQDHDDDLQDDDDDLLPGPRVTWAHFRLLSHVEPAQVTNRQQLLAIAWSENEGTVCDGPFFLLNPRMVEFTNSGQEPDQKMGDDDAGHENQSCEREDKDGER